MESDDGFVFTRARKRVIEKVNDRPSAKQTLPTPPAIESRSNKSHQKRARVENNRGSSKDGANVKLISRETKSDLIQINSNSQTSSSTLSNREKQIQNLNSIEIPKMEADTKTSDNSRRRSSIGNRRNSLGLRASRRSVFGYGEMGYPHQNISETDFYKHISAEMPEPSRMRILLSWLLQRCIEFQVSTQKEELEVSKKIQKIALESLNKHEVDTFWLRRPLFPGEEDRPYNLNPQNEENIIKKRQLQAANAKLKKEIQMWKSATSFQNTRHAACLDSIRGAPDLPRPSLDELFTSEELDVIKTEKPGSEDDKIHELLESVSKGITELESNFHQISNSTERLDNEISTQLKETYDFQESFLHPKIANLDPIKLALSITRFKDKHKDEEDPRREELRYGHSFYSKR